MASSPYVHPYDPPARLKYLPDARRSMLEWAQLTPVTTVLVVVNVLVFLLEMAWGGSTHDETLVRMGALVGGPMAWASPGTLVSYGFLHIGLFHIGMNMLALVSLGRALEPMLHAGRYFLLYTVSLVGGGLAIAVFTGRTITAGASGALFGLLGAICALMAIAYRHSEIPEERAAIRQRVAWLLLPNVLISALPGVSGAGHLGGLVVGGFFIYVMYIRHRGVPKVTAEAIRKRRINIAAALLAVLVVIAIASVWITRTPWGKPFDLGT